MRDGEALVAILARVRRRLRLMAALEGAVVATALILTAVAASVAAARWRAGAVPPHLPRLAIATALAAAAVGGFAGALRRISLERCARIVDRALDRAVVSARASSGARDRAPAGHDRVLSALAFWRSRAGRPLTPFVTAAIADATRRGAAVAPGVAAPLRRPRAAPALAAAAFLLAVGAFSPLPARGSRAPTPPRGVPAAATSAPNARVRLEGRALDAEREQAAAALRAATALGDPELDGLARALAATVADLSGRGLEQGEALDRLSELLRRAEQSAADVAQLSRALEQAGGGLQATAATRDAGRALLSGDGAATEQSIEELAARVPAAGDGARNQIAGSFDRAADRVGAARDPAAPSPSSASTSGDPAARRDDNAAAGAPAGDPAAPQKDDGDANAEGRRRLARDNPNAARPPASSSAAPGVARATPERRLQRLQRELKETAAACRADPDACHRRLQRQAQELPRMQNEARSLTSRQRLAEAVRQLRERLRREAGGPGERAREERRFLRAARGENGPGSAGAGHDEGPHGGARVLAEDPDGVSDEGDDSDGDGDGSDVQMADGAGDGAPADPGAPADRGAPAERGAASGPSADPGAAGEPGNGIGLGIGSQNGDDPLGARGALTTRGHTREAAVKDGAGPTRSEVIQSAARRGFAHTTYQGVYTDYQAVVEESLDGSAVPPGRRYIVRRYFQLIRPQSPRSSR